MVEKKLKKYSSQNLENSVREVSDLSASALSLSVILKENIDNAKISKPDLWALVEILEEKVKKIKSQLNQIELKL